FRDSPPPHATGDERQPSLAALGRGGLEGGDVEEAGDRAVPFAGGAGLVVPFAASVAILPGRGGGFFRRRRRAPLGLFGGRGFLAGRAFPAGGTVLARGALGCRPFLGRP